MRDESGSLTGFETSNFLVGRSSVVRILKRIPGVTLTQYPEDLASISDDFVHFTFAGHQFIVVEPYGDNSRYLLCAKNEYGRPHIPEIEQVFAKRRLFGLLDG